jgi:valyl-tRNA synthetase
MILRKPQDDISGYLTQNIVMKELPKQYNPKDFEQPIYQEWESGGYFKPEINPNGKPFTIIMPPTNANERAHIGHALGFTIQDALTRHARMKGMAALWLPGMDHAGFETQVVYERKLAAEGKSRFDFEPADLYKQIWDYTQANKQIIEGQIRSLGASCDWSRNKFTLDPDVVSTVYRTFKRLHDDGYLYRGKRVVNFCTLHQTSFSELEVKYVEQADSLYYIAYPIEDSEESIAVATTRPETMLGDTAVAVNPRDKRYKHLIGKVAILPLVGRRIPIVADDSVDPKFGTGAVKVTPAHSVADQEIAERHNLPFVEVIHADGCVYAEEAEDFEDGQDIVSARKDVIRLLGKLITKTEPITHSVGTCYRCGTVIEPIPVEQWMLRMKDLAKPAIAAVQSGEVVIIPKHFEKTYFQWLENIREWPITRQNTVWGIALPVWYCQQSSEHVIIDPDTEPTKCPHCGGALRRDPDVFDTWFSSGQWPLVTLGYPDGEDLGHFYPTTVMETAYEILFFWVARMIIFGLYLTGKVPFQNVYLHGLIRNEGQKMSKSKGNVIDPLLITEQYGTDALRAMMITISTPGTDPSVSEGEIEGYRNFVNKLWNIGRFALTHEGRAGEPTDADNWILERLAATIKTVDKAFDRYRLDQAFETVYQFSWHDLADWYLEAAKEGFHQQTMDTVLEATLKLLHPFTPFVTEAIWSHLDKEKMLITSSWPEVGALKPDAASANKFAKHIQATQAERAKSVIASELAGLEKYQAELSSRLAKPSFKDKAPAEVVRQTEKKLREIEGKLHELKKLV